MKALVLMTVCLTVTAAAFAGTARGPIAILSDGEFTEENGVVGGSGTVDEPYRISGWEVNVAEGERYGIRIEGTTSSFVIEGCVVSGARHPEGAGMLLDGVRRGAVENSIVQNSRHGLEIVTSEDIKISNTYLFVDGVGLRVMGASAEHFRHSIDTSNTVNGKEIHYYYGLEGKVLDRLQAGHITVAGSRDVVISGASVEDGDGITVAFSEGITVEGSDLFQNRGSGLFVMSSPGTVVRDSERIANNGGAGGAGVALWLSDRSVVENVGLYGNHAGLHISASDRVEARDNIYAGNQVAVLVDGGAREVEIVSGLIYGGSYGVELESARGPLVEGLAISEVEIAAVSIGARVSHAIVRECTIVDVAYGLLITGSYGSVERNLIARADTAILFRETGGEAASTGNTIRQNVLYRSWEGLYLGRDTRDNRIYENLFWDCLEDARDVGLNVWAPQGRGNWYSGYQGSAVGDSGVGDTPVDFGGDVKDEAPLVSPDFLPGPPGLLGTLPRETVVLEDADGRRVELSVLVADTVQARFIRLQGVPERLAEEIALLLRWDTDVRSRLRSNNVFLPLDVLFIAADGSVVGKQSMEADTDTPHGAPEPFRKALEVRAGLLAEQGMADPVKLVP